MSSWRKQKYWLILAAAVLIVVAVCVTYFFVIQSKISSPEERGFFGDMFGAVGALFSGFAFAGVIITMLQQKEELELQRQELSQTNKELELQRKEMNEQNRSLMLQRFENMFFSMLHIEQELLQSIKYTEKSQSNGVQTTEGRVAMMNQYNTFGILIEGDLFYRQNPTASFDTVLDNSRAWNNIYQQFEQYFNYIYQILRFIDESQYLSENEKFRYTRLLNSHMSPYELLFLFYHCISNNGKTTIKPLVEKYAFMHNLRKDLLMEESHYLLLARGAYSHLDVAS